MNKLLSSRINALVDTHVIALLLRLGAGALILTHGVPKLIRVAQGNLSFADPIGLGPALSLILSAFAEGICGILIVLGLGTRIASVFLMINMFVVVFFAHADDPFGTKEKGLLFLLLFILTFLTGSGKYSLDEKLFNKNA